MCFRSRLHYTVFISNWFHIGYRTGLLFTRDRFHFVSNWFHIGYRTGLLFTRDHFHGISDWPPVYTETHQPNMAHIVFLFS